MVNQKNNLKNIKQHFLHLAFEQAKKNLGKTKNNPSVGCVLVKNNTIISSACTSKDGRPHAEFNALKSYKNFKDSVLYVTLEPCSHFGKTPPCTDLIIKKGIKKIYYAFKDVDIRTVTNLKNLKKDINIKKIIPKKYRFFYQSVLIYTKKTYLCRCKNSSFKRFLYNFKKKMDHERKI